MPDSLSESALTLPLGEKWGKLVVMLPTLVPGPTGTRASAGTVLAHERFVKALAGVAAPASPSAMRCKPLVLTVTPGAPLPPLVRVYLYNLTTHLSERQAGAYRIQITHPDRGRPWHFDWSDGAFVVLAGYMPEFDVFVLWDAGIYDVADGIPFSRGCQVLDRTLYKAMTNGVAEQPRHMRGGVTETIVAASPSQLSKGLQMRWARTVDRLCLLRTP